MSRPPLIKPYLFLCLLSVSAVGAYFLRAPYSTSTSNDIARAQWSRAGRPLVICTVSRHPGFEALELRQERELLLRIGDLESQVYLSLGRPLKNCRNFLVYQAGGVSYDWDTKHTSSRGMFAIKVGSAGKVEDILALTPEYAEELLRNP